MLDIKSLLKATGNEYASIAEDGLITDPAGEPLDCGSYTVNAIMGGSIFSGLPANKITCLAGEQGVGKTFFAIAIAKNLLDNNPDAMVAWIDTEAAVTSDMLNERVGHTDRILFLPISTVQEFQTQTAKMLSVFAEIRKKNPKTKLLLILDSLGNLSTTKEMTDVEAGKETKDMTRAQLLKGAFRVLTLRLAKEQVPLLFTNHTYMEIGLFAKKVMGGGSGGLYAGSQIIFMNKSKEKEGTEQIGAVITLTMFKGRITKEGSKIETRLLFSTGLDKYYGLTDLVKEAGDIWPIESKQFVINGKKVWEKTVIANPEDYFTDDVLAKIDEFAKNKYLYGGTFTAAQELEELEDA